MHFDPAKNHKIVALLPLIVLIILTFCAVAVVLFAARIYGSTVEDTSQADDYRTAVSYISGRIHGFDSAGSVSVENLDGCEAIMLTHPDGNRTYATYIYCYDGFLRELMVPYGTSASLSAGTEILAVNTLKIEELTPGLFRFSATDEAGNCTAAVVSLRSETEVE